MVRNSQEGSRDGRYDRLELVFQREVAGGPDRPPQCVFNSTDDSLPASPHEYLIPVFDFNGKEQQVFSANKVGDRLAYDAPWSRSADFRSEV
jgi:hypothetical protein